MSDPRTAKQHNAELMGEVVTPTDCFSIGAVLDAAERFKCERGHFPTRVDVLPEAGHQLFNRLKGGVELSLGHDTFSATDDGLILHWYEGEGLDAENWFRLS